jgi:phenylalanyl-tRNA synthetase alpha chain
VSATVDRAAIEQRIASLTEEARARHAAAPDEHALRATHAFFAGKKGALAELLALLKTVAPADRPAVGKLINGCKTALEQSFEARLAELARAARAADLAARPFDLTLPARFPTGRGHLHPVLEVREELLALFRDLGFSVAPGPEVELEENNFGKLAFPPDHPATDMQDSFWVDVLGGDGAPRGAPTLLRTHTSNTQIREMSRRRPPMAVVSAGVCYRRDDDVTHSPMFHQIEGFVVDQGVSLAHLKGLLASFAEGLYGPGTPIRMRPAYFPFVEPGAEVDVGCVFCSERDGSRARCRVCKATGWLEVLGCGMIHPQVLRNCRIDPERFSGYAFGMGLERQAMLKHGIPNIRLLFENDPRFLAQF